MKNNTAYDGTLRTGTYIFSWLAFFYLPFLGGNHLALPYVTIDRFWIETTFLLFLVAAILCAFLKGQKTALCIRPFIIYFSPFLIISIASLFYTWNFFNSLKEVNTLVWAVSIVYLYSIIDDKEIPFQALVWGSVMTVLCAILQARVLYPQLSELFSEGNYARMLAEKPVPFVAFLNENMFGGFLTLILPIAIHQVFTKKRKLFICSIPLIVSGVFLSLSRLSIIVMVLECITVIFIFSIRRKWAQNLTFLLAAGIGLVIFLFMIHFHGNGSEKRFEDSVSSKASMALQQVKTLNLRTSIWKSGLRAFREQPILGYGTGAFEYAYRKYFGGQLYTRYSHGGFVKIAVELGALGLAAFLWYLFGVSRSVLKRRIQPGFFFLSICGGFLFSLVDCAFDTPAFIIAFFFISSAFLLSEQTLLIPGMKINLLLITLIILISFVFTGKVGLEKKSIEQGESFLEIGDVSAAIASYEEANRIMPIDNEGTIRLITVLTRSQISKLSSTDKDHILKKLTLEHQMSTRDQDSELYFVLALSNKMLGNNVLAMDYIRKAIALYPSSPYYLTYAVTWQIEGNQLSDAAALIRSFDPFINNIRQWGNPYGLYIYRLRDLNAEVEFRKNEFSNAISISKSNLESAKRNEFVISSHKARDFVSKDQLLQYLSARLLFFESQEDETLEND